MIKKVFIDWVNESYLKVNSKEFKDLKKWAYEYVNDNNDGFNNVKDASHYLDWFFDIYSKVKKEMILYRIIYLDKKSELDIKNIGLYFTDDSNNFDSNFIENLGFTKSDIESGKFYIIKIKIDRDGIDWQNTITTRLAHPNENEFTLKKKSKYKVISIKKWKG